MNTKTKTENHERLKIQIMASDRHTNVARLNRLLGSNILLLVYMYTVICDGGILLTCEKHLHNRIISKRGEGFGHKTSLTPPIFIELPVPSQESERSRNFKTENHERLKIQIMASDRHTNVARLNRLLGSNLLLLVYIYI
jgi:hypothetical protein